MAIDVLVHLKATDSDIIDFVDGNVWTKSSGFKVLPDEGVFGDGALSLNNAWLTLNAPVNLLATEDWTICLWNKINDRAESGYRNLVSLTDTYLYAIQTNDAGNDKIGTRINAGSMNHTSGVTAVRDVWKHLALTNDVESNKQRMFYDGKMILEYACTDINKEMK